jgi:hypothetical protein
MNGSNNPWELPIDQEFYENKRKRRPIERNGSARISDRKNPTIAFDHLPDV